MSHDDLAFLTIFTLFVCVIGSLGTTLFALACLRRIRLERPAIGVFNGRDVSILFVILVVLQSVYVLLPHWLLTSFLAITFVSSLSIGYRPLLNPTQLWLGIGLLLGGNMWIATTMLGTVGGWQVYWIETSVIVLLGASAVANLYVQGGMPLRHVARFAVLLAIYDLIFTFISPLTALLAEAFIGWPLHPAIGFRLGIFNSTIGLGDLLVYSLFLLAAYKAYGPRSMKLSLTLITVFGAIAPALTPLLIDLVDARTDVIVPAQTWFGPAAYLGYRWMRRHYGRERTMRDFLASGDLALRAVAPARRPAPVPAKS